MTVEPSPCLNIVNTVAQVQQRARANAMAEAGATAQQAANDARMAVVGQMRAEAMNMQCTLENLRNISEIDMLRSKAMNRQNADFIYGQRSNTYFAGLPIGDLGNGAANGCGIAAPYNVMRSFGMSVSVDNVLNGVGGARMLGLWGVSEFAVADYLNQSGLTANLVPARSYYSYDELAQEHGAVILEDKGTVLVSLGHLLAFSSSQGLQCGPDMLYFFVWHHVARLILKEGQRNRPLVLEAAKGTGDIFGAIGSGITIGELGGIFADSTSVQNQITDQMFRSMMISDSREGVIFKYAVYSEITYALMQNDGVSYDVTWANTVTNLSVNWDIYDALIEVMGVDPIGISKLYR